MSILDNVFTASDAATLWGLEKSTVKKACQNGLITECKKSGRPWLVTRSAMDLKYGNILDRVIKNNHNAPVNGLIYLYQSGEISNTDLSNLALSGIIKSEVLDTIKKD